MTPRRDLDSSLGDLAIAAGLAGLAAALFCLGLTRLVDGTAPSPGDIIAFDGTKRNPAGTATQVEAALDLDGSATSCLLDVRTMLQTGGSLVIEAARPKQDRAYRVHWQGSHTTLDARDCGGSADLLLSRGDLGAMASAAGGWLSAAARLRSEPEMARPVLPGPYRVE